VIRRRLLWTLDTITAVCVATVGACVVLRGLLVDEPPKTGKPVRTKRDPFTGLPEDRPN
jgi:hypothetical protein